MTMLQRVHYKFVCNGCGANTEWSTKRTLPKTWEVKWLKAENFSPKHICPECLKQFQEKNQ